MAKVRMTSTRRDFIAMLLGAPLAMACRGKGRAHLPPGALVDTGMARAHAAVRDGRVPTVSEWRQHRVVVVGSGVAGLSAAWDLRRRGVGDVVVLELDDAIGGTARSGSSAITAYPWGAHYIVAPQR
ncbi:MAG TPA: FAD-dependent oxidoreductase, partial [Kofleriaceae bacterium]